MAVIYDVIELDPSGSELTSLLAGLWSLHNIIIIVEDYYHNLANV